MGQNSEPVPNVTPSCEAVSSGVYFDVSAVDFDAGDFEGGPGVLGFKRFSDGSCVTRWGYRRFSLLLTLVIAQAILLAPTASAAPSAQESPYLQPPTPPGGSGTSAWFQPFEGLPVWAQAALFSAAVVLVLFLLVESSKLVWERMRHVIYTRERR